jgi:hypothetical protein
MKKSMLALTVVICAIVALSARAGDAVAPAAVTFTNFRGEAENRIAETSFYRGTSLMFTNCVLYAGTSTNSALQGLDDVDIEVKIGNTSTSITYVATGSDTNNGLWWCSITVPTNITYPYVQVKLTDENTNSYIYPLKTINTKAQLP